MTWLALLGIVPLFIGFLVTLRAVEIDKRTDWKEESKAAEIRSLILEEDPFLRAPLDVIIRQAEMVAEEEWRQKTGEPMTTHFSDCINCGKNAIYVAGRRAPVSWVLTDPCRLHRSQP